MKIENVSKNEQFKVNLSRKANAFTLIEMLIVLLIISVLILLFVPNLSKYKNHVDKESQAAVVQLVDTQKELYALQNDGKVPTIDELLAEGYIKQEHADVYNKK
ncbi:competence protein ComGC [Enterococcus thailandicus]|uniref:ComG operon protein 3 n=1 Tax=bioreactor metagenome TaxID=1076179 RepID=A0A645AZM7_9ZZZZ|nr:MULTISPECIES: competence type IV pilus major pilin ComGC [Enterococcus]ASZ08447.1 competence protein ComG [Enterococcus thailandicus]MDK4351974.1 competence type IV pilus major pilin ComGC [Enterococcus thailandicus]MDT2734391.1 competence type IV pilus major pilin ComGC [Enterococcus thailandicus]MEA4828732.1 competence type IV pilus major pilin ComGC [Enterococcus thailandicus]OTP23177.1 competence protein ComGC [Enterococcus sp. 5B7_DIV0075]